MAHGQMLVPDDPALDEGVYVRYPGWAPDDYAQLCSCLDDGMVDQALAAGRAKGDGKSLNQAAYNETMIRVGVITARITGVDGKPLDWTPLTVRKLPVPIKQWLVAEIGRCDGALAGLADVEIGGHVVRFRPAM